MTLPSVSPASLAESPDRFGLDRDLEFPGSGLDDPESHLVRAAMFQHQIALLIRSSVRNRKGGRLSLRQLAVPLRWTPSKLSRVLNGRVWLSVAEAFRLTMVVRAPLSKVAQKIEGFPLDEAERAELVLQYLRAETRRWEENLENVLARPNA
ncbi:MAG: hypothetical protein KF680_04425 [Cryobacterium sp.]|nr:hypothetical protein [Cryobacterium sp.]